MSTDWPPGPRPPLSVAVALDGLRGRGAQAVILVEGWSDQAALEALARRRGRDLVADGVAILPMGGITNLAKFVQALGPQGAGLRLAGLCDEAEAPAVARQLHRLGVLAAPTLSAAAAAGFHVCRADLEDELVRALGAAGVEAVLEREGELVSYRRFQDQPAQRGRDAGAQLRRFLGTRAHRKIRYGGLLVEALPMDAVPPPLDAALAATSSARPSA